jgi:predicted nuclease of restriction endonuclease-like (RecB) superfamily
MKKRTETSLSISPDYLQFIEDLKGRVISARVTAARAITHEAILLFWDIGRAIVEKQRIHAWGESVVELVATDLRRAFPESKSFSADNVWRMRQLYSEYADPSFLGQAVPKIKKSDSGILGQPVPELKTPANGLQPVAKLTSNTAIELVRQIVAQIPWGQNLLILRKVSDPAARLWYLRATARFGWSRNVLLNQIKAGAYERAVTEKKTHNFGLALPEHPHPKQRQTSRRICHLRNEQLTLRRRSIPSHLSPMPLAHSLIINISPMAHGNHQHHQLLIPDLTQNPVITDPVTPQACEIRFEPLAKAPGIFFARNPFVQISKNLMTGLRAKFPKFLQGAFVEPIDPAHASHPRRKKFSQAAVNAGWPEKRPPNHPDAQGWPCVRRKLWRVQPLLPSVRAASPYQYLIQLLS